MKKFIKMIAFFTSCVLLVSLCWMVLYVAYYKISVKDIPAPNISNSYSFNEKMEFLRNAKVDADIIAIGSSMSLNNLYSKTITDELHSTSFLNTASWGISIKDDFLLLKILSEIHKPSTIIIASVKSDFSQTEKKIDYASLKKFLLSTGTSSLYYHLKYFDLKYYFENFRYAKKVRSCTDEYDYLGFDSHGTLNFDSTGFKININRWNTDNISTNTFDYQYSYLDSISTFCKAKNIKLLFFQSPYRNGLYATFDEKKLNNLRSHFGKVESILKKNGQIFINASDVGWLDQLFVDGIHFNTMGAKKFTEYCFQKYGKYSAASLQESKQQTNLPKKQF